MVKEKPDIYLDKMINKIMRKTRKEVLITTI